MTTAHYPDRAALRQRIQAIHSSGVSLAILASGGGFELLTGRVRFYSECSWPVSSTEIRGGGAA